MEFDFITLVNAYRATGNWLEVSGNIGFTHDIYGFHSEILPRQFHATCSLLLFGKAGQAGKRNATRTCCACGFVVDGLREHLCWVNHIYITREIHAGYVRDSNGVIFVNYRFFVAHTRNIIDIIVNCRFFVAHTRNTIVRQYSSASFRFCGVKMVPSPIPTVLESAACLHSSQRV